MTEHSTIPLVLAIGGHDPCGGAGLQADIEAIAANGCRAVTVVTALTTQNTCGVQSIHPQSAHQVLEQCRLLLEESNIGVIKIGLLGNAMVGEVVAELLEENPNIAAVLDPVLASGTSDQLADDALQRSILERLCPNSTLITPNSLEARTLTGRHELEDCASSLVDRGCAAVLITGTHENETQVSNRLYGLAGLLQAREWPRLPGSYHGSGCTLAAAVAAGLAQGLRLGDAVDQAQKYTWSALSHAFRTGRCQYTPNRFFAAANRELDSFHGS